MTNDEIKTYIENEGLGYSITSGISSNSIKDVKLRKLWKAAERALSEITDYLEIES